jgi:hypothetical protein
MAPRPSLTDRLKALGALKDAPAGADARAQVTAALADKSNLIVAAAARVACGHGMVDAADGMCKAFDRFARNPLKTDKLCHAKLAVVDALDELGSSDEGLFLAAARWVQHEPAYGGSVDTAVKLRIRAAQALVRMGSSQVFEVLQALLVDGEPEARRGAGRLLSGLPDERSELLLRMRIDCRDPKAENYEEYFASLLALAGRRAVAFVARFLDDGEQVVAEEAALALGESRQPEAFGLLRDLYSRTYTVKRQRVLLMALSLLRSDEAALFLVQVAAEQTLDLAISAIDALRFYRDRGAIMTELRQALERRGEERLIARLAQMMDGG